MTTLAETKRAVAAAKPRWHVACDRVTGIIRAYDTDVECSVRPNDDGTLHVVRTRRGLFEDEADVPLSGLKAALDAPMPRTERMLATHARLSDVALWHERHSDARTARIACEYADRWLRMCARLEGTRFDPRKVFAGWLLGEQAGSTDEQARLVASGMSVVVNAA